MADETAYRRKTGTAEELLHWLVSQPAEYVIQSLVRRHQTKYAITLVRRCEIGCGSDEDDGKDLSR